MSVDPVVKMFEINEKYGFLCGWNKAIYYMQLLEEEEFGESIEPRLSDEEAYKVWMEEKNVSLRNS